MSRREDIDNAIWSDPDFHDLSAAAKLVYIWSFTNPRCGMSGLYRCSTPMICFETALAPTQVDAALDALAAGRFVFFENGLLWVRARVKHLRTRTKQIAVSIRNDLVKAGEHRLVAEFVAVYGSESWLDITGISPNVTLGSVEPTGLGYGLSSGTTVGEETEDARVRVLFDYWRERCNHSSAKLTSDRRRKIAARLREGYSPEAVREGIDGAAKSPFINDSGVRFDDIELICRTGSKLESFMGRAGGRRAAAYDPNTKWGAKMAAETAA